MKSFSTGLKPEVGKYISFIVPILCILFDNMMDMVQVTRKQELHVFASETYKMLKESLHNWSHSGDASDDLQYMMDNFTLLQSQTFCNEVMSCHYEGKKINSSHLGKEIWRTVKLELKNIHQSGNRASSKRKKRRWQDNM